MRITIYGIIEIMENLRQRLARLLRQRMDTTLVDTQVKVAKGAGIAQATVQRILSLDQAATVDRLDQLGKAFGVPGHHMLLDPDESKLLQAWAKLGDDQRAAVLGYIEVTAQINGKKP